LQHSQLFADNGKASLCLTAFVEACFGFPSADKLRQKFKNAAGLCAGQGIGTFCMQGLRQKGSSGKKIPARSVLGFVREMPCAQRSISADLIFWLLFYQEKSNSLRGN